MGTGCRTAPVPHARWVASADLLPASPPPAGPGQPCQPTRTAARPLPASCSTASHPLGVASGRRLQCHAGGSGRAPPHSRLPPQPARASAGQGGHRLCLAFPGGRGGSRRVRPGRRRCSSLQGTRAIACSGHPPHPSRKSRSVDPAAVHGQQNMPPHPPQPSNRSTLQPMLAPQPARVWALRARRPAPSGEPGRSGPAWRP
mmetsp:Transcript_111802/g.360920  ORF Transcript_111802/g.360920 Transcript_111802/m.360920 type:complete len:201 (+) Transcript_111802:1186-1788(+)